MKSKVRNIELLAPARDAEVAIEAIKHGADAVYMGPDSFGARAMAGNSTSDIERVANFAHQFNVKVYATVNTILYDSELGDVERLINDLYHAGVDAIIVQDHGLLRLDIPPIALHSSTQCDLRTPRKALFLASLGYSQLVMARELTLKEIADIHEAVPDVPLEAFVHGALCVSYSGRCQVSQVLKGRSANRGACAQMCRLSYDLEDNDGNKILRNKHLLSLRDFNASHHLNEMLEAGVSSFKIEGRLKDAAYVKNVVAYYRHRLDEIIAAHPQLYRRASAGASTFSFNPQLDKSFNRSFTDYFLAGRHPSSDCTMASVNTPKSMGERLGKVISGQGKMLRVDSRVMLSNGDGISYFDPNGVYAGFRVNRVEGCNVMLKDAVNIPAGAVLYRTFNKAFEDALAKPSAERRIAVDAHLRYVHDTLALKLSDERGNEVTHSIAGLALEASRSSQEERQREVLAKLGNTIYDLRSARLLGLLFIPSSLLTRLRRETIELLEKAQRATRRWQVRGVEEKDSPSFAEKLDYADNVANHLAAKLFSDHHAVVSEPALECEMPSRRVPVMHTRYCLRRELGACKLDRQARQLPEPLFLCNGSTRLRVECDCRECEMKLYVEK